MLLGALIWAAAATAGADKVELPFECRPIPEAASAVTALNAFWNRNVHLCQLLDDADSAYARPEYQLVEANRRWLADIRRDYGAPAAVGILAHEWAHLAHPALSGPQAELHADCLAGAFLRWAGFGQKAIERFALLSLHSGDGVQGPRTHGSGPERRAAVLRGYRIGEGADVAPMATRCQP